MSVSKSLPSFLRWYLKKTTKKNKKNTANGKEDFQGRFVVNVFTLETDCLSETGYSLDNSRQTDNKS